MKNKILATLVAAAAMITASTTANAQCDSRQYHGGYQGSHHRGGYQQQHQSYVFISGYQRCGTPVYSERYIRHYDCYGRPVYAYRTVRHRPQYVRPAPRGHYVAPCPPPRHSSRGRISIRF
jgi:hypothetical protein